VAVDEVFQLGRNIAPFKAEAAQYFLRGRDRFGTGILCKAAYLRPMRWF
jgi:hypothetical protein